MVLKRGIAGDPVKVLQRGLNKLGAMLLVDGDYGKGTEAAVADARETLSMPGPADVADDELQAAVAAMPDPFPPLTAAGVTFIARQEVSDASRYRTQYQKPCWPGSRSGITIGIGYDCSFVGADQLRADWGAALKPDVIAQLAGVVRKIGSDVLLAQVNAVVVPLPAAMKVFTATTLPRYLADARRAFPQIDDLSPWRRSALISLVYNRGAGLKDLNSVKQERKEMRNIRALLAAGEMEGVAAQFELMTRLWDPAKERGLIQRRRDEATLWRNGFAALKLE
jgi:peptidoglycan hydrolase-like protein with peptidoglycan-binding domain